MNNLQEDYQRQLTTILAKALQTEQEFVDILWNCSSLATKQKILCDFPIGVVSAKVKDPFIRPEDVQGLVYFRQGKSELELNNALYITSIITDRQKYLKNAYSERELALELSKFIHYFRENLDQELFRIIDRIFEYTVSIKKEDIHLIKQGLDKLISKNESSGLPTVSANMIKHEVLKYSQKQAVTYLNESIIVSKEVIKQIFIQRGMPESLYFSFWEAIYLLVKDQSLSILEISKDSVAFTLPTHSKFNEFIQRITFNHQRSLLKIDDKEVPFNKGDENTTIIQYICDHQDQAIEFEELSRQLLTSSNDKNKALRGVLRNIENKVAKHAQISDLFERKKLCVKINPIYLD